MDRIGNSGFVFWPLERFIRTSKSRPGNRTFFITSIYYPVLRNALINIKSTILRIATCYIVTFPANIITLMNQRKYFSNENHKDTYLNNLSNIWFHKNVNNLNVVTVWGTRERWRHLHDFSNFQRTTANRMLRVRCFFDGAFEKWKISDNEIFLACRKWIHCSFFNKLVQTLDVITRSDIFRKLFIYLNYHVLELLITVLFFFF